MIEEYHFGSITIDGKTYNHDVEVRWTGEVLKWWRRESHLIDVEDVKRAIEQSPDTIIIGTGESGVARVTEEAKKEIKSRGIELIIDMTEQATKTFNIICERSKDYNPPTASSHLRWDPEEGEQNKVIGLFHLTC
jgi:hypothetical protein